jgi:hypothetical protein
MASAFLIVTEVDDASQMPITLIENWQPRAGR